MPVPRLAFPICEMYYMYEWVYLHNRRKAYLQLSSFPIRSEPEVRTLVRQQLLRTRGGVTVLVLSMSPDTIPAEYAIYTKYQRENERERS